MRQTSRLKGDDPNPTEAGRVVLSAEPLEPTDGVRVARVEDAEEDVYCSLSALPVPPRAFRLRLHDSHALIHWEPDGYELPFAGRVFCAVLKALYNWKRWRVNLALSPSQVACSPMTVPVRQIAGDDEDRERDGIFTYLTGRGLSHAFSLSSRAAVFPDEVRIMDYWWCPRRALAPIMAQVWSNRSSGYVAPWPDQGALEACFEERDPASMMHRLLSLTRLAFQGDGGSEGESMIVLSHHVSGTEIEDALNHNSVRRALRQLNEKALLVDWVFRQEEIAGHIYKVREKPRPGGAGVSEVYAADEASTDHAGDAS
jgi:hypothetical protein